MNKSLVTIYITNYNYGNYIEESIESVLNQTYYNYELIIIDDGSTDNSFEILKKYKSYDKIKIIYQKQKGLTATNNVALRNSNGVYIVRLDADDYLDENAIELMVNELDKNKKIALVFPDYTLIDRDGNRIKKIKRHNFDNEVKLFDQPAHGACTLIRVDILKKLGGYDEEFDRQDGYSLWLKVIRQFKVKNINKSLFYYRQHNTNLTQNEKKLLYTRAKIKSKAVKELNNKKKEVLTIIPVRGQEIDSNSQPMKEIKGKPLINWTIDAALESQSCNHIYISTPDNNLITYIKDSYGTSIKTFKRDSSLARLNIGIEHTILELLKNLSIKNIKPDYILLLYIEYPFKEGWQIDEALHTAELFDVEVVDGIILNNEIFYKHDGSGLKPLIKDSFLHLEREQLYRRVGSINLIKTEYLINGGKIMDGRIGHINLDQKSAFQIKSNLDWQIANFLAEKKINE